MTFETLISVEALAPHVDDPKWRVFDCRFSLADPSAGTRAYEASHIPNAVRADIDLHLAAPHVPGVTGRHPMPRRDDFIAQVARWGVTPETQVAAYDEATGAFAARLWWMLRWIGHAKVAVLDGGWAAWTAQGLPVTDVVPRPVPASATVYAAREPLTRLVGADDIDPARHTVLDARDLPRFRGEVEPIDPVAGHIPGARCSPSSANVEADGRFKSRAALREKFAAALGDARGNEIVCYCGSGITAAHNILALRHAGFGEAALYAGSWSEWITDPARGVATGD